MEEKKFSKKEKSKNSGPSEEGPGNQLFRSVGEIRAKTENRPPSCSGKSNRFLPFFTLQHLAAGQGRVRGAAEDLIALLDRHPFGTADHHSIELMDAGEAQMAAADLQELQAEIGAEVQGNDHGDEVRFGNPRLRHPFGDRPPVHPEAEGELLPGEAFLIQNQLDGLLQIVGQGVGKLAPEGGIPQEGGTLLLPGGSARFGDKIMRKITAGNLLLPGSPQRRTRQDSRPADRGEGDAALVNMGAGIRRQAAAALTVTGEVPAVDAA